jgi:hypothetical protein
MQLWDEANKWREIRSGQKLDDIAQKVHVGGKLVLCRSFISLRVPLLKK